MPEKVRGGERAMGLGPGESDHRRRGARERQETVDWGSRRDPENHLRKRVVGVGGRRRRASWGAGRASVGRRLGRGGGSDRTRPRGLWAEEAGAAGAW